MFGPQAVLSYDNGQDLDWSGFAPGISMSMSRMCSSLAWRGEGRGGGATRGVLTRVEVEKRWSVVDMLWAGMGVVLVARRGTWEHEA